MVMLQGHLPFEAKHSNATGYSVQMNSVMLQVLQLLVVGLATMTKSFFGKGREDSERDVSKGEEESGRPM